LLFTITITNATCTMLCHYRGIVNARVYPVHLTNVAAKYRVQLTRMLTSAPQLSRHLTMDS